MLGDTVQCGTRLCLLDRKEQREHRPVVLFTRVLEIDSTDPCNNNIT